VVLTVGAGRLNGRLHLARKHRTEALQQALYERRETRPGTVVMNQHFVRPTVGHHEARCVHADERHAESRVEVVQVGEEAAQVLPGDAEQLPITLPHRKADPGTAELPQEIARRCSQFLRSGTHQRIRHFVGILRESQE